MSPDHTLSGRPSSAVREVRFALVAAATLAAVRIALWFMPYGRLEKHLPDRSATAAPGWVRRRTFRAVANAARLVPGASCLPQAIAGQILLTWQGFTSTVRIGVASKGEGLKAHAWLLSGDHLVLGGTPDSLAGFTKLTDLRAGRS